jgi:ABC-type phosphate/phosphonate transport system substrate-binding protein
MYDWPEVRSATRDLERTLQIALCRALNLTDRDIRPWPEGGDLADAWTEPDLLLSQTCGYPLTHALSGKVRLVGTPHYDAEGCEGPRYCSQLIVHRDSAHLTLEDLRGKRAVFNDPDSQSGMNAFRHAVAQLETGGCFFSGLSESGSHLASLRAVADGRADIASIDAVCWALVCREVPDLARQLRPLARTASAPGLPLITSRRFSEAEHALITEAVAEVFTAPETRSSRERLGIQGFSNLSADEYAVILKMEAEASGRGYPVLA